MSAPGSDYYKSLGLAEIFSDLASRFVINLPFRELESIERICFQVEESHWFYTDFIRPIRPDLPNFTLRRFSELFLISCSPHLSAFAFDPKTAYDAFLLYKTSVPVRGALLLNAKQDKLVLVKGWKSGSGWGFPRGKINQDEDDRDCCIREVWEETSYDASLHFDPRRKPHNPTAIDSPQLLADDVRPETADDYIELDTNGQKIRLYIITDVPEDYPFVPRTRKEISKIAFFPLKDLPGWHKKTSQGPESEGHGSASKFYLVAPALRLLRQWMKKWQPEKAYKASEEPTPRNNVPPILDEPKAAFSDTIEATRALQDFFLGPQQSSSAQVISGLVQELQAERLLPVQHLDEARTNYVDPSQQLLNLLNTPVSNGPPAPEQPQRHLQANVTFTSPIQKIQPPVTSPTQSLVSESSSLTESSRQQKRAQLMQDLVNAMHNSPHLPQHPPPDQPTKAQDLLDRIMLFNNSGKPAMPSFPSSAQESPRNDFPSPFNQPHFHRPSQPVNMTHQHQRQPSQRSQQLISSLMNPMDHFPSQPQPNMMSNAPNINHFISQPLPVRPIHLLTNFQSPPPGPIGNFIQPNQQQNSLLSLLNMPLLPPNNMPNFPTGSPQKPMAHL